MAYQWSIRFVVLLACTMLQFAQASEKDTLSQRYYQASGMYKMLESLPESIASQMNYQQLQDALNVPGPRARQLLNQAIAKVSAEQVAFDFLNGPERQPVLSRTLDFLTSPLGQKVIQAEVAAGSAEAQQEMQIYRIELASKPAPAEREALIQALMAEAHMVESMMNLMERLYLMIAQVLDQTHPNGGSENALNELQLGWSTMKPAIQLQFEQLVKLSAHYSYRDLSVSELQQYISFLKTNEGEFYWQTSVEVVNLYVTRVIKSYVSLLDQETNDGKVASFEPQ